MPTGQTLGTMQYTAINKLGYSVERTAPAYGLFGGAVYDPAELAAQPGYWYWPVEGYIVNA